MTNKKVLTVQDISCVGQCSLTVALPIMSACGIETCVLPSAVLSTHTGGFTGYTFRDLTDDIPKIMKHWDKEGIRFDVLYTGYLGSEIQIEYVKQIKEILLSQDSLTVIDPAMADNGKLYAGFTMEFVQSMKSLCSQADVMLPNITEASLLTGIQYESDNHSEQYIDTILDGLMMLGCKSVVLKGILNRPGKIGIAVRTTNGETQYYYTDRIDRNSHGTGDCYASAFVGGVMQGLNYIEAASLAADFVVECIKKTMDDDNHRYGVKFEKALPLLVNRLNN